uniref:Small multi-drug export protein n=1 Tax=Kalanchoe fedtschenkoi TaxID=63787 RepID=A0A7N0U0Q2_KALFE
MAATLHLTLTRHKPQLRFQPPQSLKPIFLHTRPFGAVNRFQAVEFLALCGQRFDLVTRVSSNGSGFRRRASSEEEIALEMTKPKRVKFALLVLFWAAFSIVVYAASGDKASAAAAAASDSIRASSVGVRIAAKMRGLGWPDEAVVFALATLPVIELRGAIPVGYWMQLRPIALTALAVAGNMVPVPFIILYLKRIATFLAGREGSPASRLLDLLFKSAKKKAGPVEEFQWLGLMLFVAVPFPGTGAWTGAIVASVLDMPFWSALTANFCGVVLAAVLVNLIVNLGLRYAIAVGVVLFLVSTFMWSILRRLKKAFSSSG